MDGWWMEIVKGKEVQVQVPALCSTPIGLLLLLQLILQSREFEAMFYIGFIAC